MDKSNSFLVNSLLIAILLGAVGLLFMMQGPTPQGAEGQELTEWSLQVDGEPAEDLMVEFADTQAKREQGLSGVESLPQNQAMFFIFEQSSQHGMWMKGMNFSLDMAWITENGRVVHSMTEIPVAVGGGLPVYQNDEPARYVLEMRAGSFERLGIEDGVSLNVDSLIDETDSV